MRSTWFMILTYFFVLNLVGWFGVLSNKFIIVDIPSFYCYDSSQIINSFLSFFWRYISFLSDLKLALNRLVVNFLKLLWFFNIPLLYYFNLGSSIISCLSSRDTHLSLGISLSCSFVTEFDKATYSLLSWSLSHL